MSQTPAGGGLRIMYIIWAWLLVLTVAEVLLVYFEVSVGIMLVLLLGTSIEGRDDHVVVHALAVRAALSGSDTDPSYGDLHIADEYHLPGQFPPGQPGDISLIC